MMKKFILLIGCLAVILVIGLVLIPRLTRPREEQKPVRRPLPAHTLQTIRGEHIQIQNQFPNQNYLFLFFAESSKTSLQQIAELAQVIDFIPADLTVLLIHLGRMKGEPPDWTDQKIHLLIDPEAQLAQIMGIRCVPTLFLLHNDMEEHYAETLVLAEELTHWFLPAETHNHPSLP